VLAPPQRPRQGSEQDIAKALTGNWRDEHLFVLRQALAMYTTSAAPGRMRRQAARAADPTRQSKVIWAVRPARAARRARSSTRARFWQLGRVDLTRINGLGLAV